MGASLRVLLVQNSEEDAQSILHELEREAYKVSCGRVDTPEAMRVALGKQSWDVVISAQAMPKFSSFGALELLKEKRLEIPFIIVSGQSGEEVAVTALKAGA